MIPPPHPPRPNPHCLALPRPFPLRPGPAPTPPAASEISDPLPIQRGGEGLSLQIRHKHAYACVCMHACTHACTQVCSVGVAPARPSPLSLPPASRSPLSLPPASRLPSKHDAENAASIRASRAPCYFFDLSGAGSSQTRPRPRARPNLQAWGRRGRIPLHPVRPGLRHRWTACRHFAAPCARLTLVSRGRGEAGVAQTTQTRRGGGECTHAYTRACVRVCRAQAHRPRRDGCKIRERAHTRTCARPNLKCTLAWATPARLDSTLARQLPRLARRRRLHVKTHACLQI